MKTSFPSRQLGFGVIAAIVILVVLAGLAAALVSTSNTQHLSAAQDVLAARAWQAARAGNEWGLNQALPNNAGVCAASTTLDLRADTGFFVTVSCRQFSFNEAGSNRIFFEITSTACPVNGCPSNTPGTVATANYIERSRVVIAAGS